MALRKRFKQVTLPNGKNELVEIKVPPKSEFQMDNRDYLNEPQYKGYKHVKTIKGRKMLMSGLSGAGRESWDRIFNKGK